jgi:DNA processing protein
MELDAEIYWVALSIYARIGGRTMTDLLRRFSDPQTVLEADMDDLQRVPGVGPQTAAVIKAVDLSGVALDLANLESRGGYVLTWTDQAYPVNLLHLPDAPPVLLCRGDLAPSDSRAVAVIGTREPTAKAERLAYQIGYEVASREWTVVSGLAFGIDAAAHNGALDAGGRTLAVLGGGVLNIYPSQHETLASELTTVGALLSEMPPQAPVSPQSLIARNRITSGLSKAVIVVQSSADSGSAATARRAFEQGRVVYAVIGNGDHADELLAQGAHPLAPGNIDWDLLDAELKKLSIAPPPAAAGEQLSLF